MQVVQSPLEYQRLCVASRRAGQRIGFVPTMGALHAGHLALIERARQHTDKVFVSVFVNPTQFGKNEDFASYPNDLAADVEKSAAAGAEVVFAPAPAAMYVPGEQTRVLTGNLAANLCGASRPGHFAGVCTVVNKLFNLTGRCSAVFGKKDYQQFRIIERMVQDLFLPVELIAHPIVREADGLAMSSRNRLLVGEQRQAALGLPHGLDAARAAFAAGERAVPVIEGICRDLVERSGLRADYVSVVEPDGLAIWPEQRVTGARALLAAAAFAGETRLIDNVMLGEDPELLGR